MMVYMKILYTFSFACIRCSRTKRQKNRVKRIVYTLPFAAHADEASLSSIPMFCSFSPNTQQW